MEEKKRAPKKACLHDGHRGRMRDSYAKNGLDGFAPHEVLELLLFCVIPRGDTNATAHELLLRFGSISGVFEAPKEELLKVANVGESSAMLLKMIPEICRYYMLDAEKGRERLTDYMQMGDYFVKRFIGRKNETVYLLLLSSNSRVLFCDVVNEGSALEVRMYVKQLVRLAARYEAVYAVLAHNHPSGSCVPSKNDLEVTVNVFDALNAVEVCLLDHIIVADGSYLSLAHAGFLRELFSQDDEED